MNWQRVMKSLQALTAHTLLLSFTILLVFKLHHRSSLSWWVVFFPLWMFHGVVARGRFSLPAPAILNDRYWAPCHAIVATPLLIAFELLLCIYLESLSVNGFAAVSLKIVFLPLLALEIIILIDNFRMCQALMPGDEENITEEAAWEMLPHFWVAISMVFFIASTIFTLLKLCATVGSLSWWELFVNLGVAEGFAFLVCTKWSSPTLHREFHMQEASSSFTRHPGWSHALVVSMEEARSQERMFVLQSIAGHIMKIPIVAFQVLLFMHLEGTPPSARKIPLPVIFSPLFLLQSTGVIFATSKLLDTFVLLQCNEAGAGMYFMISSKVQDCLGYMHHGSRLLGWWSIDEGSREEQARLFQERASCYSTFCRYPPEIVKKLPKKDLTEEVWKLQAALGEQTEITKCTQQEIERLQNEKVLCRVCFEKDISIVLLPCRHRILCSICCLKCKKCPVCRISIEECLPVYDV